MLTSFNKTLCCLAVLLLAACTNGVKPDQSSGDITGNANPTTGAVREYTAAKEAMANDDDKLATKLLTQLTENHPQLPGPWTNLGILQYKNKDYASAQASAQKAIALKSDYAEAYNLLAMAEVQLGDINIAKQHYTDALNYRPDYSTAHYNLALLYDIYYQDIDNAILHYIKYLELTQHKDQATKSWLDQLISQRKKKG